MNNAKVFLVCAILLFVSYGMTGTAAEDKPGNGKANPLEKEPLVFLIEKDGKDIVYKMDGKVVTTEQIRDITVKKIPRHEIYPIVIMANWKVPFSLILSLEMWIEIDRNVHARYFLFNDDKDGMDEYILCNDSLPFSTTKFPVCKRMGHRLGL